MSDPKLCARCNDEPASEAGILGQRCRAELEARRVTFWYGKAGASEDHA